MAYNTKEVLKDRDGNPISQYFNTPLDKYEPVEGSFGANKVLVENNDISLIPILDKLSQLTGTVIDEETRKTNETSRKTVEATRVTSETTRKTAETGRVTAETDRVTKEEDRVTKEIDRVSKETTRVSSENTRVSNENTRKTNETTRGNNELTRIDNEDLRIALYDDLSTKLASGFFKGAKGETGNGLEYTWNGTQLGVRVEGTTEYVYVDLKGEKGEIGEIENLDSQMITDALGYVPLSEDSLPNNLETTTGSQAKANQAEQNAKDYTDSELASFEGMVEHGNEYHSVPYAKESDLVAHKADGASHSKTARFVIGTSTAGWTSKDCDYLCDGTADQVEINQAIQDLPVGGGEIVILDGTYNITAKISINKSNVTLRGNGKSSLLQRKWLSTVPEGVITIEASVYGCIVKELSIDGFKATYNSYANNANIFLTALSGKNIIEKNYLINSAKGVYLSTSKYNIIKDNTFSSSNNVSNIYLVSSHFNQVLGNIFLPGTNNVVGVGLTDSSDNVITNNIIDSIVSGIQLENSSERNNISNNALYSCSYGIQLNSESDANVISNNVLKGSGTGIRLDVGNNIISSNTVINSGTRAIHVNFADFCVVNGNNCYRGTGTAGDYTASQHNIHLYFSSSCIVTSNLTKGKDAVIENSTGGILANNKS